MDMLTGKLNCNPVPHYALIKLNNKRGDKYDKG